MTVKKNFVVDEKYIEFLNTKDGFEMPQENTIAQLHTIVGKDVTLKGMVTRCKPNGDLIVQYGNAKCLMPRENVSPIVEKDGKVHKTLCINKVGTSILFKVKAIEDNNIIIERCSIVADLRKQYLKNLKIGQVISGRVYNIDDKIGCFLDIGADHLAILPKKYMEHIFVNKITDHINIGEVVTGEITDIVYDEGKTQIHNIVVSRVAILPKFDQLISEYSVGDIVIGEITSIAPTCIYANLDKHLSISCLFSANFKELAPGQKVRIKIKKITNGGIKRLIGEIISIIDDHN